MEDCLFCKIAAGDIPSKKLYEDEQVSSLALVWKFLFPGCSEIQTA